MVGAGHDRLAAVGLQTAAISAVSVATATRPISAFRPARTWTIIGAPAISAAAFRAALSRHAGGNQHQNTGFNNWIRGPGGSKSFRK